MKRQEKVRRGTIKPVATNLLGRDQVRGERLFHGPEGEWFKVLPASRGWHFACLQGPVSGMPQPGASPQNRGWGPLYYIERSDIVQT